MSIRTLIIDDDAVLARSIGRMLKRAGFDVRIAVGAQAGLAAFNAEATDLVLCDYQMPFMNGLAVLREMQRSASGATLCLMTGSDDARAESAELPVLLKPFDLDAVLAALS